jgi:hypothetical protein
MSICNPVRSLEQILTRRVSAQGHSCCPMLNLFRSLRILAFLPVLTALVFAQLQHTSQTTPDSAPTGRPITVQAASANEFVDSIGVVTHFTYPSYKRDHPEALKSLLIESGIRHIRDADIWPMGTFKSLAAHGIRVTWIVDPNLGVIPNRDYWCNPNGGPRGCYLLADFLKNQVGPGVFDAIESMNEPDGFFGPYKWHAAAPVALNGNKADSHYWKNYALALTKDICAVVHGDPALRYLKCVGPALGGTSDRFPPGSMYGVVDYGNMHPYPRAGNGASPPLNYDTIRMYFQWGNSPALNMDEHPYVFKTYEPAYTGPGGEATPMMATETGYCTGTAKMSVTPVTHAKYMPRLFAEYFRHGIVRTFSYEFYDQADHPTNCEANFGLIYHDLRPKPAYLAITSLISVLKDDGAPFQPGTFSYAITATPVGSYNRLQYVHDLLLQKSTGDYYLLLWHEISNAATSNGTQYASTAVDISPPPPDLPVTIRLPRAISSATLYTYAADWKLKATTIAVKNNEITLRATDTLSVIRLHN